MKHWSTGRLWIFFSSAKRRTAVCFFHIICERSRKLRLIHCQKSKNLLVFHAAQVYTQCLFCGVFVHFVNLSGYFSDVNIGSQPPPPLQASIICFNPFVVHILSWFFIIFYHIVFFFYTNTYTSKPVHMLLVFFLNCLILLMFSRILLILFGNQKKSRRDELHEFNPTLFPSLVLLFSCSFFCWSLRFSDTFFCGSSVLKALATGLHVGRLRCFSLPRARIRSADPQLWMDFQKAGIRFLTSVLLNHTCIFPQRNVCRVLLLFLIWTPQIVYKSVRMQSCWLFEWDSLTFFV